MPITTKTPVDAQVEKILAKYFPSVETFEPRNMDSLDFHEVFVADLKRAVAEAFAAGRDFEGTRRDKREERDARAERASRLQALGVQPHAFWCWTDADIQREEKKRGIR